MKSTSTRTNKTLVITPGNTLSFHQVFPRLLFTTIFFLISSVDVFAATKTFTTTGNFGDKTKWNGNSLPSAGDDLRINGTCTIDNNVLTDNVAYGTLIIGNGLAGSLSWVAGGTNRLNVNDINGFIPNSILNMSSGGTLIVRGTITETNIIFTGGGGTVERRLPVLLTTLPWVFNNLVINTAGTISTGINLSISGNLTITSGTFSIGAFSLTVAGTTTVNGTLALTSATGTKTFGTLIINGTFNNSANEGITITKNLTNNGTFTQGTGRVTFTGAASNTISGTAPITAFGGGITVNKGTSTANVLDVQCVITMLAGGLTLTTGTFKLSSASTIKPFTTDISGFPYRIPNAAGLWCNGGVINTDDDCTVDGLLRISNGVFNLGSAADNRLRTVNCLLTVDGGELNIAGRITPTTATDDCSFVMSAGTIRVATIGSGGSIVKAPFDMTGTSSSFTMSGGTIIVMEEGGAGPQNMGFKLTPGISNVTGGTIQMGDALTPPGSTMNFFSSVPLYNLVVNSANVIVVLDSFPVTTFKNNVTIAAGTLNTDGLDLVVGGNWTNNATFLSTTAKVTFNGTGTKTLGGSSVTSFYKLTLSTPAATDILQLTNDATVTSLLTLTKGVLNLNTNALSVTSTSTGAITRTSGHILSEQTNNSSQVIWTINNSAGAHTFPFGTAAGTYIPFVLTVTTGNVGKVTASTYPTSYMNTPYPSTPTAVTNMNSSSGTNNSPNVVDRFWQIDKAGATATATFTFTATAAEIGSITYPTAQRYESSTNKWDAPLPGQTNTTTSATVSGVTKFSPWTLSGNGSMLPIELLSFTAVLNQSQVDLNWTTAAELNNDYFTVEKTIDLINYEAVAVIDGAGNSTHSLTYSIPDPKPYSGVSYYRLKQTDYNGTETYSSVVSVNVNSSTDRHIVFPNPLIGTTISIKLPDVTENEMQVIIYNMNGQVILSKKIQATSDKIFTITPDDSEKLLSGVYLFTLFSVNTSYQEKLIVP